MDEKLTNLIIGVVVGIVSLYFAVFLVMNPKLLLVFTGVTFVLVIAQWIASFNPMKKITELFRDWN
jgi:uncharacterized membrane protein YccC